MNLFVIIIAVVVIIYICTFRSFVVRFRVLVVDLGGFLSLGVKFGTFGVYFRVFGALVVNVRRFQSFADAVLVMQTIESEVLEILVTPIRNLHEVLVVLHNFHTHDSNLYKMYTLQKSI